MLEELGNLVTSCSHVDFDGFAQSSNATSEKSRRQIVDFKAIALVAIGNPLIEKDCKAASLLREFPKASDTCRLFLDDNSAWLGKVLTSHNAVVIIDSVANFSGGNNGALSIVLTPEVLNNSGFAIRSTHGLSWLDEIKFCGLEHKLPQHLIFFGIDATLPDSDDSGALIGQLETVVLNLTEHANTVVGTGDTPHA